MKKSELKSIINSVIREVLSESSIPTYNVSGIDPEDYVAKDTYTKSPFLKTKRTAGKSFEELPRSDQLVLKKYGEELRNSPEYKTAQAAIQAVNYEQNKLNKKKEEVRRRFHKFIEDKRLGE
jgi:hypothetical protein